MFALPSEHRMYALSEEIPEACASISLTLVFPVVVELSTAIKSDFDNVAALSCDINLSAIFSPLIY